MRTQNGWSTENLMLAYLQWLSDRCNNSSICLIWDQYKAHMTNKIKEQSAKLNIEIIYIPEGQTGSEQPLDRLIFGSMKKLQTVYGAKDYSLMKRIYIPKKLPH